jgi:hypothetical protein
VEARDTKAALVGRLRAHALTEAQREELMAFRRRREDARIEQNMARYRDWQLRKLAGGGGAAPVDHAMEPSAPEWALLDAMRETANDGTSNGRTEGSGCSHCGSADVRCEWPTKVCRGCGTVLDRVHFNAHKARRAHPHPQDEPPHPQDEPPHPL